MKLKQIILTVVGISINLIPYKNVVESLTPTYNIMKHYNYGFLIFHLQVTFIKIYIHKNKQS